MTAAARLLAGLGIVVEYPQALVALALAVYLGLQRPVARRLLAYCGGVAVGVLPLLVYDAVAFGNPFELSYAGSQIGEHERGFYGVVWPDPRVGAELLGGGKGMLTLTPVVAAGVAGLVALFRRGHRAEAATCGALVVAFLTYNAGFFEPFGGWVPGPRFLVPVLPFVALGLAAAYAQAAPCRARSRRAVLAFVVAATVTSPMIPDGGPRPWLDALRNSRLSETVVSLVAGDRGWTAMLPFFALVAVGIVLAIVSLPSPRVRRADLGTAGLASSSGPSRETPGPTCSGPIVSRTARRARRLRPAARRIVRGGAAQAAAWAARCSSPWPRCS